MSLLRYTHPGSMVRDLDMEADRLRVGIKQLAREKSLLYERLEAAVRYIHQLESEMDKAAETTYKHLWTAMENGECRVDDMVQCHEMAETELRVAYRVPRYAFYDTPKQVLTRMAAEKLSQDLAKAIEERIISFIGKSGGSLYGFGEEKSFV